MLFRRNPEESNLVNYIKNDDIDSFRLLVDSIINVNYKFSIFTPSLDEYLRFSPSLLAVSAYYQAVQIFRYLLLNGADLTIKDKRNVSIVHFAVYGGNFEILHLLDEYGVSFDGTLFTAAERGLEDIFKWILYYKSEDLHQRRKDGTNLIDASSKGGNWKLTSFILELIKDDLTITEAFRLLKLMKESKYDQSDSSDDDYEYEENGSDNDYYSDDINENNNEDSNNKINKESNCCNDDFKNDKLSDDNDNDYSINENSIRRDSESESANYEETENDESENDEDSKSKNTESDDDDNENKNTDKEDESENTDDESTNTDKESNDNGSTSTDKENDDDESESTENNSDDESKSAGNDSDDDTNDSKTSDSNTDTDEKSSISD